MGAFDIAICLDEGALNDLLSSLYARSGLRARLFSGSEDVSILGSNLTASWTVLEAPTVVLNPPSADQWRLAIKQDGSQAMPQDQALVIRFGQIRIGRNQVGGGSQEATTSIEVICTAALRDKQLDVSPLAAVVDLSGAKEFDRTLYRKLIIPKVLQTAGSLVSGRTLPDVSFAGAQFGDPLLHIGQGKLLVVASLAGNPAPAAAPIDDLPAGRLSVLLSPQAVQRIAGDSIQSLDGKSVGASGSRSFGIGDASYSGSVRFSDITAGVSTSDPTIVNASVGVSASASAGVDLSGPLSGIGKAGEAVEEAGKTLVKAISSY